MTEVNDPVETGDAPSLEELSGEGAVAPEGVAQQEPAEQTAETGEPKPDPKDPAEQPEKQQPFWYRKEIEKERKERQRLQQELERLQKQAPQAQPQTFENPQDYIDHVRTLDRLERSEDRFIDKHGEQEFEAVRDWLATRPDIEAWAIQQRHPWGAAFQQYQRDKLSAEIGDDPNAWREKERERLRAEILAETGGQTQPQAGMAPRIPAPASSARSAPARGGYAGPPPLSDIGKNRF